MKIVIEAAIVATIVCMGVHCWGSIIGIIIAMIKYPNGFSSKYGMHRPVDKEQQKKADNLTELAFSLSFKVGLGIGIIVGVVYLIKRY